MEERSLLDRQRKEIRDQIHTLEALAERLPESKAEAMAQIDSLEKNIRVMSEDQEKPQNTEDETYLGS